MSEEDSKGLWVYLLENSGIGKEETPIYSLSSSHGEDSKELTVYTSIVDPQPIRTKKTNQQYNLNLDFVFGKGCIAVCSDHPKKAGLKAMYIIGLVQAYANEKGFDLIRDGLNEQLGMFNGKNKIQ